MTVEEKIAKIVRKQLQADFKNVEILDVQVKRDIDFDGDEVLRIDVVLEGKPRDWAAASLSGMTRHVRTQFNAIGEEAFPIFSFISDKEVEKPKIACA